MRSKYLEEKEITALRGVMGADWLPYQIAIETGLRVGDVAKLRWRDLQGSRLTYIAEKTDKEGIAYVSEDTAKELWARRRRGAGEWIFPAPTDFRRHISRQLLWKRLKAACRVCRVNPEGISPHSFRKVYGVREYRAHGLSAAQAGLQHTDLATTEIYALSDWLTSENADKPLLRSDLSRILHYLADWLGIPFSRPPRG